MNPGMWREMWACTIDEENFRASPHYLDCSGYDYAGMREHVKDWIGHPAFTEDAAFGCQLYEGVSRDLLDSFTEIDFLEKCLGADFLRLASVLDIGAGYGRFAHRYCSIYPGAYVKCTDTIEVSRRICERYLRYRGVSMAAVTEPERLDPVYDLAVNIHSWSECSMDEVCWWLDWLKKANTPRIFIVPHNPTFGVWSRDKGGGNGPTYRKELKSRGYSLSHEWTGPSCQPKLYTLWELLK